MINTRLNHTEDSIKELVNEIIKRLVGLEKENAD
jgi:predicted AAA+ superfamily ATPase